MKLLRSFWCFFVCLLFVFFLNVLQCPGTCHLEVIATDSNWHEFIMNWMWILNIQVLPCSSPANMPLTNALLFTSGLTYSSVQPAWFEVAVFLAATDVNNPNHNTCTKIRQVNKHKKWDFFALGCTNNSNNFKT